MRRQDQDGARSMAHHHFRRAADEDMLESGAAVRDGDDQVRTMFSRGGANGIGRRPGDDRSCMLYAAKVYLGEKLPHERFGIGLGRVLKIGETVDAVTLRRQQRTEIERMRDDDFRREALGELNREF